MLFILFGNFLSFVAMLFLFYAISRRDNKTLILFQGVSHFFFALSGIIIKGYSGAVQDGIGCLRNILIVTEKNNIYTKVFLVSFAIIFGLIFNNRGWVGVLPVLGTFQYTLVSTIKHINNNKIQLSIIVNAILMIVYSICIMNYVNIIANIMAILVSGYTIKRNKVKIKN